MLNYFSDHSNNDMSGVSLLLPVQADVQLSTRLRADLLCHDGWPGHAILATESILLSWYEDKLAAKNDIYFQSACRGS